MFDLMYRKFYLLVIAYLIKLKEAQKASLAFIFASIFQQGISFLITPFFARMLSVEEFGLVSVYNSLVDIIGPVAMLSLSAGIFNVGMVDFENSKNYFMSALLGLSNIATILTMGIVYIIDVLNPSIIGLPKSLIELMFLYFLFYPAVRFWSARQRFELKYKYLTLLTLTIAVLAPTIGLCAVLWGNGNLGVLRLWGTNSILILFGVALHFKIVCDGKKVFDKHIWKYAITFSLPLIPHYLSMYILASSDKVMIRELSGIYEAGLYGLAYTASMIINVVWSSIQGSLTPYVYDKLKKNQLHKISEVASKCIVGFSIVCLLANLVAPEFMIILGGEKYLNSVPILPPLISSTLFMAMYNLFSMIEFYYKKTIRIMLATSFAAFINIVFNYLAIPVFGYVSAAYTTLLCYILYCIFHYLNMKSIEPRRIYDLRFLAMLSIIFIILSLSSVLIYPYALVRYGIVGLVMVIAIYNRKKINVFATTRK